MALHPIINSFSGGEISGKFEGRTDLKDYYVSCRELTNFLIIPSGGVVKVPGTYYVAEIKDSTKKARLIEFEYTITQSYIIELGTDYFRIYDAVNHSYITELTNSDPYTEDELWEIQYAQQENDLYLVHPSHSVKKINYNGTTWSFSIPTFTGVTFSSSGDYPKTICFYQNRLILASTDNDPQTVWGSKTGSYTDFTLGTADDDAFEFHIAMDKKQRIQWVLSNRFDIFFGTNISEWKITSSSGVITPQDQQFVKYSEYGSADIKALLVNEDILFVQRAKRSIRNYVYSNTIGGYQSANLMFKSDHLFRSEIKEIALQQEPFSVLWVVKENGQVAALSYDRVLGVMGWSSRTTDGEIESVAVVTKSGEDEVWFVVKRNINGSDVRYIEYTSVVDIKGDRDTAHYCDCGAFVDYGDEKIITNITQASPAVVTSANHGFSDGDHVYINDVEGMTEINDKYYTVKNPTTNTFELYDESGTAVIDSMGYSAYTGGGYAIRKEKSVSGLNHLEGEEVVIYADGGVQPEKTVSSGTISLTEYANKIHVGLPYTSRLKPMKLEIPLPMGTMQGRVKRIFKIVIRLYETQECQVGEVLDNLEDIIFRTGESLLGEAPSLFSGDKEVVFRGDFGISGDIYIVSENPVPITVTALMPILEVA